MKFVSFFVLAVVTHNHDFRSHWKKRTLLDLM